MPGVLIISRDWQSRALLRAQLIEEGCEVRAVTSPGEARQLLGRATAGIQRSKAESRRSNLKAGQGPFAPALVVVDVSSVSDRPEVEQLRNLLQGRPADVPLWIIASRCSAEEEWVGMLKGPRLEKVLFRPIDAGKLVEEIKSRVQGVDG